MTIPKLFLNNSKSIPNLGLGTWKADPGLVAQAVKDAIDIGYRHIDCAFVYQNEAEVGKAISEKISSGIVRRSDLFITSKLWCTFHSKQLVKDSLKESLKNLSLDYIDLYLIHWPWGLKEGTSELFPTDKETGKRLYSNVDYLETWLAMEECYNKGFAKAIGLSNFNHKQIDRILEHCSVSPSVNQIECHPYLAQSKLINYCKEKGIIVTAYAPLGSPGRPWAAEGEVVLMENPTVLSMAKKYDKTPAQILIRFQLQRGLTVIPKSVAKSRIESNFKVFDFSISDEDMTGLATLDGKIRYFNLEIVNDHPHYPFNEEF